MPQRSSLEEAKVVLWIYPTTHQDDIKMIVYIFRLGNPEKNLQFVTEKYPPKLDEWVSIFGRKWMERIETLPNDGL